MLLKKHADVTFAVQIAKRRRQRCALTVQCPREETEEYMLSNAKRRRQEYICCPVSNEADKDYLRCQMPWEATEDYICCPMPKGVDKE